MWGGEKKFFLNKEKCDTVIVYLLSKRSIVFSRGIPNGLIIKIPFGGHTLKKSIQILKLECSSDQKILKKNIISDKIKKTILSFIFFRIFLLWKPR